MKLLKSRESTNVPADSHQLYISWNISYLPISAESKPSTILKVLVMVQQGFPYSTGDPFYSTYSISYDMFIIKGGIQNFHGAWLESDII